MRIFEPFLHFFTPRHTNNHRAKALHLSAITTYIVLLLIFQIGMTALAKLQPGVLGYASNITVPDLLKYTNADRQAAGIDKLALNDQLTKAATDKANDMFVNQYWAHTSPAGRDPWSFISDTGYTYLFAGENLARDFGDSKAVVDAWMNSASHKENLLNSRYQDVGFAVVNGKYNGYETTLVVQLFGAKAAAAPTVEAEKAAPQVSVIPTNNIVVNPNAPTPKVDIFLLTKNVSLGLILVLLAVLIIDSALVYKRKTVRLSGHNLAHLIFLIGLLVVLNFIGRGLVL